MLPIILAGFVLCMLEGRMAKAAFDEEAGSLLGPAPPASMFDPEQTNDILMVPGVPSYSKVSATASRIAVIDSGLVRDHPQLRNTVVLERSFVGGSPRDTIGHGTSVALLLFAPIAELNNGPNPPAEDNGSPFAIISLKVTESGAIAFEPFYAALEFAIGQKVDIVNISLGFEKARLPKDRADKLSKLIRDNPNVMIFAASGNRDDVEMLPARCGLTNVIAVGTPNGPSGPADILANPGGFMTRTGQLRGAAETALAAGDLVRADRVCEEMKSIAPGGLDFHLCKLQVLLTAGKVDEASRLLDETPAGIKATPQIRFFVGVVLFHRQRYTDALPEFLASVSQLSGFTPASFNLGQTYLRLGRPAEALDVFLKLQRESPGYPNIGAAVEAAHNDLNARTP